jgi:transcription elongation GreA/GreB family factor
MDKELLKKYLLELVESSIQKVAMDLNQIQQSANEETKSSAGDKYETGRAMAQLEIEKLTQQQSIHFQNKEQLLKTNVKAEVDKIKLGSLVRMNNQLYFISISLGKIVFENENIFCISSVSPIGQLLLSKNKGEEINWNNQKLKIEEVY